MSSNDGTVKVKRLNIGIEEEIKQLQKSRMKSADGLTSKVALGSESAGFDSQLYQGAVKSDYASEIVEDDEEDELERKLRSKYSAPKEFLEEIEKNGESVDPLSTSGNSVLNRQSEYHSRRLKRVLSPERKDPFDGEQQGRGYASVMRDQQLEKEEQEVMRMIQEKRKEAEMEQSSSSSSQPKKRRWDVKETKSSEWDDVESKSHWDQTQTPVSITDSTPKKSNRWDQTPVVASGAETPSRRSRWDETPVSNSGAASTPSSSAIGMMTPVSKLTSEQIASYRFENEMDIRNRHLSDEELDGLLPSKGYAILEPPANYVPIRTPARKLTATPTPMAGTSGFAMADSSMSISQIPLLQPTDESLPFVKPEDYQHFSKLLDSSKPDDELSLEEIKEKKIMRLLLKMKNGTPQMRKQALKQLTMHARDFGAGPLFNQILPLLMSPTLDDQERHLLVKVIDRILYKLDDLVRPYVHKILVVIEPLLIDEDYYARIEGREIISNLSKAAGLATMISALRPDVDHTDEYVRNTTSRAFSVVASALGIPSLLPFLKAVCNSKKSWQARHTGIKIVQQIAILMGCAVLPHLKSLVAIIAHGLTDEQHKVRTITALAISALAESSAPYGIESFEPVFQPLWKGIYQHRGKVLASFLKAIGFLIPLMNQEYANYYTREVMVILIREFQTPDEEMKKIVLKVVKQCVSTEGVDPAYIRDNMMQSYLKNFWVRRMALDRRNVRAVIETTVAIAERIGTSAILSKVVDDLKDESEPFRKMVIETMDRIVTKLGALDVDARLEELLVDGLLFAFQEQTSDDLVVLNGFGAIVTALGERMTPYMQQLCRTVLWRLNNKSAKVRQQAADLISRIAPVMMQCREEKLVGHFGMVLYESLGEEYPEVLGSFLGGLKSIVNVIGMEKMSPPIKDLLPRLTPILRNRHEKVQENVIDLVGRIADRAAEQVSAREWMRICFELLDLVKAHKKSVRRSAINTFGYIAKAIGPQDVLATLLNNLKVQERQMRICTTIAIAIVAETCGPFTVLPALMNEYRVPEMNVQNGVLKAMSFLFEYIGEMAKDYVFAVATLLEDALMDRDLVHRQIASATMKHVALGVVGMGCDDVLLHLLNFVWPNIFEVSPHMMQAVLDALEGFRVAVGPGVILSYVLQGLFHPARRVRDIFWKIYNNLYLGNQDQLTAFYPRLENDENNLNERFELDLWI